MLPALRELVDELAGVAWCSWKSNEHLTAGLAGETDLDLLVARADAAAFRAALARHGVVPLVPPDGASHAGTEHALGFDRATGRLFHLHVHHQLVLGERFVKGYRLPIEARVVATASHLHGVPAAAPDVELSLLVARALLKYRARDTVKDVLRIRSPGISDDFVTEIEWLSARTTREAARAAAEAGGVVPGDVVAGFLDLLPARRRDGVAITRLRTRLRRALRSHRRCGPVEARVRYARGLWRTRRGRPQPQMRTAAGGTTIALVGADGAGKSTLAAEIARWLGWKIETRVHYMGSKPPSRRSRWCYTTFRALRRLHRSWTARAPRAARTQSVLASLRDGALALHHLSVAFDRRRRHRRARRDVRADRVVIFDRFPLVDVGGPEERMLFDGPQIRTLLGPRAGVVARALAAAEERVYRRFHLPDLIVVLTVDHRVAAARKPDHGVETLSRKTVAASALRSRIGSHPHVGVTAIDANRDLPQVLADLKAAVWDAL
jgi:hypothetical protein